jgi:hypothetical protein
MVREGALALEVVRGAEAGLHWGLDPVQVPASVRLADLADGRLGGGDGERGVAASWRTQVGPARAIVRSMTRISPSGRSMIITLPAVVTMRQRPVGSLIRPHRGGGPGTLGGDMRVEGDER